MFLRKRGSMGGLDGQSAPALFLVLPENRLGRRRRVGRLPWLGGTSAAAQPWISRPTFSKSRLCMVRITLGDDHRRRLRDAEAGLLLASGYGADPAQTLPTQFKIEL
jgi:hypothetical protein